MSIFVSDVEKISFTFEIRNVAFVPKRNEALIDFELEVIYEPYRDTARGAKSKSFQVRIKTSELEKIKKAVEKKKEELNEALDKIKGKIRTLLELQGNVEVHLGPILDELFDVSKKGFVPKEES